MSTMTRAEVIRFLIIRTLGNFLLLFAIFGVFATFGPAVSYEFQYRIANFRGVHYSVPKEAISRASPKPQNSFAQVLSGPKEQILVPPDPFFSIIIPKIGAASRVIPNVDTTDENIYLPALQEGVAHAKGTVFPGISGNTYLFAHSADNFWDVGRYNAVFYLLKDLTVGDDVIIFFENKRYDYKVVDSKIVDPSEVSYIVQSQEPGKQRLILQTCWPPGTSWKRQIVIAEPK